ncbi:MAG: cation transporter [Bacteroidetes bacterium]|nr:cation transporter [Bacteroidota bacterium]
MSEDIRKLYRKALLLSIFTIGYNLIEGLVSVFLGYKDETLTLFGFGIDSFIEVISGSGILLMVLNIRRNQESSVTDFEITALKITGFSFYGLSVGLIVAGILSILHHHTPVTTFWGIIISLVSIAVMLLLVLAKLNIGKKLNSDPIIADANCAKVCIYMSVVLLFASFIYELTGFAYADILGAVGLIWFSVHEGQESMTRAKEKKYEGARH